LEIEKVTNEDKTLNFKREKQIILIDFGKEISAGDTVSLSIKYRGKLDNSFCYLDIPKEELNKVRKTFLYSIDKQYSFQTDNYMLLTPETYWYPRPGVGYSDESPDWQQTYFSRFTLNVIPLPGLIPLSQGEGIENTDGSYSFSPEYPVQAISLTAGKYRQKSCVRDSILYSVWHIEGNDFFYATALDSIRDTIPALIQEIRENMERNFRLSYPFKRFSVVEVPAQFFCYPHAWSQAQEVVQPEMEFVIEKGFGIYWMNFPRNVKSQQGWRRGISHKEAQIWAFRSAMSIFTNSAGNYSGTSNRGSFNLTVEANRYYVFPQFFNFRYNIFSTGLPIANRLIELYLLPNMDNSSWIREINGISNPEKASLLLEQQPFKDLIADVKYHKLMNDIVGQKAFQLFAPAEINLGVNAIRDSLYAVLNNYTFRNVQLENLLDTLGRISNTDILSSIPAWNEPVKLPAYSIETPEVINVNDRGKDFFVVKAVISNDSDYDGIVQITLNIAEERGSDPRTNRKIMIPARRSLQLVSVWENTPNNMTVNTMISGNLPMIVNMPLNNDIKRENRRLSEKDEDIILPEDYFYNVPNEVIVDNEDSTLFTLSKKPVIGLLPKLLDNVEETQFKYSGLSWWNAPLQWTASTHEKYYGKYIRSAYVVRSIRNKGGNQTATWKIPVPSHGQYELYYYMFVSDNIKHNRRAFNDAEYRFKVSYGKDVEEAYINVLKAKEGWEQLGVYYFDSDTVNVTLSNECKIWSVTADAVKIVKR
jgi:hypothetical protein